jgi:hypothetical protein
MSRSQDIRAWAADHGMELSPRGRLPREVQERYDAAHNGHSAPGEAEAPDDGEPLLIVPDGPELAAEAPAPPPVPEQRAEERAPVKPPRERKGLLSRKPGPRPAGKKLPRVSTESLIGGAWAVGASLLSRQPVLVPTARMMAFQSGTVGVIGDQALRGTWADRVLQPLARAGEKGEIMAAIIGPPVIVAACTLRPELYPVAQPVLKMLIMTYLELSEPAMEKIQKRIDRMEGKLGGAKVDDILASVFADVDVPTAPSPDEEAAVRRAREQE